MLSDSKGLEGLRLVWRLKHKCSEKPPESTKLPGGLCQTQRCGSKLGEPPNPDYLQAALAVRGPGLHALKAGEEKVRDMTESGGAKTFKRGISSPQPPFLSSLKFICLSRGCLVRKKSRWISHLDQCLLTCHLSFQA